MDLIPLTPHTYHLRAGLNAGLVVQDGRALLVDTGLDRDAARRILKHVALLNVELAAVPGFPIQGCLLGIRHPQRRLPGINGRRW